MNGGGIITLQFQRNPFYPIKKSVYVSWNDIHVIQNPIIMLSVPDKGKDFYKYLDQRAFSMFYNLFSGSGMKLVCLSFLLEKNLCGRNRFWGNQLV